MDKPLSASELDRRLRRVKIKQDKLRVNQDKLDRFVVSVDKQVKALIKKKGKR